MHDFLDNLGAQQHNKVIQSQEKTKMTKEQLEQFKSNYCEMIVDSMDMDCLLQMCHDLLMDSYKDCTEEELKEEILDLYDDSVLSGIIGGNV